MAYLEVGDNIRDIRKLRGLNQDQLAEMACLNRVTVAKYESGKVEPGAKALCRIADALEVSVDMLLGREQQETPPPPALDDVLVDLLINLTPAQVQRVKDFVQGMKAADKA